MTTAPNSPDICPKCGHPLGRRKPGRKPATADALRAEFGHGRGFTVAEAAAALGISIGAARQALGRMADAHALGPINREKVWAIKPQT